MGDPDPPDQPPYLDLSGDLYARLGLQRNCTDDQIHNLYDKWNKYRPMDKWQKLPEENCSLISEAFSILVNSDDRKKYDEFGHSKFVNVHKITENKEIPSHCLWLGDIYAAYNSEFLKKENITSIISILHFEPILLARPGLTTFALHLEDVAEAPILNILENAIDWIKSRLDVGSVLVHCKAGVSRSGSVVIAYLMKFEEMPFENALIYAQSKRDIVEPNSGFISKLKKFQEVLDSRKHC